jgi:hypothetical protein
MGDVTERILEAIPLLSPQGQLADAERQLAILEGRAASSVESTKAPLTDRSSALPTSPQRPTAIKKQVKSRPFPKRGDWLQKQTATSQLESASV